MPANVGEMFYTGEIPSHGLGVCLALPATLDEALKVGGLNWEVGDIERRIRRADLDRGISLRLHDHQRRVFPRYTRFLRPLHGCPLRRERSMLIRDLCQASHSLGSLPGTLSHTI